MGDLTLHFIAGFIISFIILMLKKPIEARRPDWLVLTAIGASIAAGVAKEAGDYFLHWGTAEVADITLTWSGGMVALACVALYDWIRYRNQFNKTDRAYLPEVPIYRIRIYAASAIILGVITAIL